MKRTITVGVVLVWIGLGTAHAAEHLWENFDTLPLNSIANQPGWTGFLSARTAQVSNVRAHSPDNSLRFPWNTASPNATAATYTNLNVGLYGLTGKVVRLDFQMFLGSTNVPFSVTLHRGGGELLSFINQGGVGRIGFDPYNATAVPLAVNRFVPVTMLYHAGRHQYALEYDGERVVNWSNAESANVVTQFHYAIFLRAGDTAGSVGDMFMDNIRVETYPYDVWAWWRFTWSNENDLRVKEQLGQFLPAWNTLFSATVRGASDWVWDGWHDFHNEGATRYVLTGVLSNSAPTPVATDWTLETVVRISEDRSQALFHWRRDLGYGSTEAMIEFGYRAGNTLGFSLRDAEQSTTDYDTGYTIPFTPSGRWRHVALVKSGTTLLAYVDFQAVVSWPLNTYARGVYQFSSGTRAALGRTLNNANQSSETTAIDEIRFSSRALEPYDFLQPGEPVIVQMGYDPGDNTWDMLFKGILGKAYRIETSPAVGSGENWVVVDPNYVVDTPFSYFWNSDASRSRFIRIIRK